MASGQNQYFVVAKEAYRLIVHNATNLEEAWSISAEKNTGKNSTRNKSCPKQTFLGLCESGDLKKIAGTQISTNRNYLYAKFAISEWRSHPELSTSQMWDIIRKHFPDGAANHNRQLDVVKGVWEYLL